MKKFLCFTFLRDGFVKTGKTGKIGLQFMPLKIKYNCFLGYKKNDDNSFILGLIKCFMVNVFIYNDNKSVVNK